MSIQLILMLKKKRAVRKLNNSSKNFGYQEISKHQNIQKLDLNFLPKQSKKRKTIHQTLEYKIMYLTFIQSREHVSMKNQEETQKKQQGSQSNIILRTLESQFSQTNYQQFQGYGSNKSQIGQQLSQQSLPDVKEIILPDTHKRNSTQKSNLDLKINSQSKSSTQLKEKRIQDKRFIQQIKQIRSIKSVDLNDSSESSATNRILFDILANQSKILLDIKSTLTQQNQILLGIQTAIEAIHVQLIKMNNSLKKIDENMTKFHKISIDKLNNILNIMFLKEQDDKIKSQIHLALHGHQNFRYQR
ncbi:hypothetical protein ABPG72_002803 [Tetrahymena utriculariae]